MWAQNSSWSYVGIFVSVLMKLRPENLYLNRMSPWLSKAKVRRCDLPSKSNVLEDSVEKDIHHKNTRQMKTMKYLRESCYHYIECSVANSLAILMRKWYLNSNFQPYNYSQRLQEDVDGTRINISNPIYTWKVEMKEGK